ncbi:sugar ABC transporter permease [Erysipelothrix larvae]|uniref:Sugar ABC transporter permease n=1 Tax=Erysipelothrix larvae TaxID=1514105 RepID=A0A0X8H1M3_9FIRM|nr:sugar ABC transporter permease [Erysipelothrix larvae]AMC94452.1 sugar ABC transporter permease [Erysipelothrix larvae]
MGKFKLKYSAENSRSAWLFLLPTLLIVFVFSIYPLFRSFIMSFQSGRLGNMSFNGIRNYQVVITDPKFHDAMKNTALYAFAVVPIGIIISLVIAWLIFDRLKFKSFFETIFFLPYLTSTVAIGVVFRYLFNFDYGMINHLLGFVGIAPINFLDNVNMSVWTLIIFGVWSGLAFNIIILLSGLRSINQEYYKVADMFGATKREQFFKITVPQLIPIITFLFSVGLISAFKVYTQVFALFGGKAGIANSAMTAVFYIYDKFYVQTRFGQGMAATIILFVIILLITFIQNKVIAWITK